MGGNKNRQNIEKDGERTGVKSPKLQVGEKVSNESQGNQIIGGGMKGDPPSRKNKKRGRTSQSRGVYVPQIHQQKEPSREAKGPGQPGGTNTLKRVFASRVDPQRSLEQ